MNNLQKESTAKFMYDLSKGIALLTVVKPSWEQDIVAGSVFFGFIAACLFFAWAYTLEVRE